MPRTARKKVDSQIYHIVLRGINKQTVFFDNEDREVFLNRIKLAKEKGGFEVYAFCLMSNHIHLLIKEAEFGTLGSVFRRVLSSFVYWYNSKYKRIGNLFQDRFRSEGIVDDGHLLCAVRYIHQNPVQAGIAAEVGDYAWSSHSAYISQKASFVDTEFVLSVLGGVDGYLKFMSQEETEEFAEDNNRIVVDDREVEDAVKEIMHDKSVYDLQKCDREQIDLIIAILKQKVPLASLRQISRVTGIPVGIVRYIN